MQSKEVTDFQFRALRRVRVFDEKISASSHQLTPFCIAISSTYGICVIASQRNCLFSLKTEDIHKLIPNKTNINVEVTDCKMKRTTLMLGQIEIMSLACSCDGRILSLLVNSPNGPFVHLFDICYFSTDCPAPVGKPFQSYRISSCCDSDALFIDWNPVLCGVFVVAASDGSVATVSIDINKPEKLTVVGSAELRFAVTCVSWSPKGKQLVLGDNDGLIHQYKPEMIKVRDVAAPTDFPVASGAHLRCSGICWLATTDFLVAYSPTDNETVAIARLTVKKNSSPVWKYIGDVMYCTDRSPFPQKVSFLTIQQWDVVFCASTRSCEVAVFGKLTGELECWTLEDNVRLEMPVNKSHEESFPMGFAIDLSSQQPFKLYDDQPDVRPPCPVVMVLSSHGLLLPFNILSLITNHTPINMVPIPIPQDIVNLPSDVVDATLRSPVVSSQLRMNSDTHHIHGQTGIMKQEPVTTVTPLLFDGFTQFSSSLQNNTLSPVAVKPTQSPDVLSSAISNKPLSATHTAPKPPEKLAETMQKEKVENLRQEFKSLLTIYDAKLFEVSETIDWMADLRASVGKILREESDDGKESDAIEEIEKIKSTVEQWVTCLEQDEKDLMVSVMKGEKFFKDKQDFDKKFQSNFVLEFDTSYRMEKIEKQFNQLQRKIGLVENFLAASVGSRIFEGRNRKEIREVLCPEDEEKVRVIVKRFWRAMAERRKSLIELKQKYMLLAAKRRSFARGKEHLMPNSTMDAKRSVSDQSVQPNRVSRIVLKDVEPIEIADTEEKRNVLVRSLAKRAQLLGSPQIAKVLPFPGKDTTEPITELHDQTSQRPTYYCSAQAFVTPIRISPKKFMDIGTQSPDFMSKASTNGTGTGKIGDFALTASKISVNSASSLKPSKTTTPLSTPICNEVVSTVGSTPLTTTVAMAPYSSEPNVVCGKSTFGSIFDNSFSKPSSTKAPNISTSASQPIKPAKTEQPNKSSIFNAHVVCSSDQTRTVSFTSPSTIPAALVIAKDATNEPIYSRPPAGDSSGCAVSSVKSSLSSSLTAPTSKSSTEKTASLSPSSVSTALPVSSLSDIKTGVTAASNQTVDESKSAVTKKDSNLFSEVATTTITTVTTSSPKVATDAATTSESQKDSVSGKNAVSFSFKLPSTESSTSTTTAQPTGSSLFGNVFNSNPTTVTTTSLSADEGMMEDENPTITTGLFSSALSMGSGGTQTSMSSTSFANPFASGLSFSSPMKQQHSQSPFASTTGTRASVFGGKVSSAQSSSVFGGNASTSSNSPGLFAAAMSGQTSSVGKGFSSLFGGGSSAFGAAPSFGSKPTFGSSSPFSSSFSNQSKTSSAGVTSGAFSAFAQSGGSSGFGALASRTGGSVFGGGASGGFGALAQNAPTTQSSVFGGGSMASGSSFTAWR